MAAAFTAANGDVKLTRRATIQTKAYYAALAGVNRYQYQLTSSPEYWTKCPTLGTEATPLKVTGATDENYTVKTLGSTGHTCESGKQATILETGGTAKGTFRILSTGTVKEGANTVTRKIVATFSHPGFTKYVYESNYEVEDPVNFKLEPKVCEFYYSYRSTHGLTGTCPVIQFAPTDEVNGPMHTNDAAAICTKNGSAPKFGREGRNDEIAMNGGHYAAGGCTDEPNIVGKYTTTAGSILPPETDAELLEAAGTKFDGRTEIELRPGTPNTMVVKNKGVTKTVAFPSNGVVYVENSKSEACAITNYTPFGTDTVDDGGCGNVYVHGEYTESLTIASADDVIVNGNLTTTNESSGEPTGGATLGLIAENFVRVYHPVKTSYVTKNIVPATQPPINEKCVTMKELSAKVLPSTEVSEVATTGLSAGDEVEGTVAGEIEAGTTISEVKTGEKLKMSKAAKPPAKELSAKLTNNSTEVKEVNTTGLVVGAEVEGTVAGQIEAGTTISAINAAGKTITLSKAAQTKSTTASGIITKATEVKEINTTGLVAGEEVEGTGIEAGTTISKIEGAKALLLNKAAKPTLISASGKTNKTTEVKEINTTGLVVGAEVEGSGIEAKTTITSINVSGKTIKLSKAATKSETTTLKFYGAAVTLTFSPVLENTKLKLYGEVTKLKFYHSTGYAYNPVFEGGVCHKVESGYSEYRESENRYITTCEGGTKNYEGGGFCKIEFGTGSCPSRATELNAEEDPNGWGMLKDPVIDAAILSTNHSWIVDNYKCGNLLGTLTVWGSIAQFWRGPVGTSGGSGYIKNYNYDDRLANQQPPSFLAPTNATSWKVSRETAAPASFTG
ncbi:MAG TPA: hypothetical protein VLJ80_12570 [Solirubrobacteraceae bacterium]|nr:hypothetical protein [Solirubrobacteraceae bacterium]